MGGSFASLLYVIQWLLWPLDDPYSQAYPFVQGYIQYEIIGWLFVTDFEPFLMCFIFGLPVIEM